MSAPSPLELLGPTPREAGPTSCKRFLWALGLDRLYPKYRVLRAVWGGDRIQLAVDAAGAKGWLAIHPPDIGTFVTTSLLSFSYEGTPLPPAFQKVIAAAVPARLHDASFERVAALLLDDPDIERVEPEQAPRPAGTRALGPDEEEALLKLGHRRLAAGPKTRERLAEIFGLDEVPPAHQIKAAAWVLDHLEFSLDDEAGREVAFTVETRAAGQRGMVTTDHLVVAYRARDLPELVEERITAVGPRSLEAMTLGTLARLLLEDPLLGQPGLPEPPVEHFRPANQLDSWGTGEAYADFFASGEMARGQLDSLNMFKSVRTVQHCDSECMQVNPVGPASLVSMVDYPWEHRVQTAHMAAPPSNPADLLDVSDSFVTTDLSEDDVILGNPDKLRDVLDYLTHLPNPKKKPIFVSNTCVPVVTGEDVDSVVRSYRKKSEVPILFLTMTPKSMNEVMADLFVGRRLRAEANAPAPEPRTVNLIGFGETPSTGDLRSLLSDFDLRVNGIFLPEVEPERLDQLPHGALNVFYPNALWNHLYEQLRRDSKIPFLEAPAPHGVEATRAWVEAIVDRFGRPDDFDARWEKQLAPHRDRLESLRERARRHRLGLVFREDEIRFLTDPAETWGVPLAEAIREYGFGLDVVIQVASANQATRLVAQAEEFLGPDSGARLSTVRDFAGLRATLRESEASAVLSHHFYDWRLTEAGKSRFTLQHFEVGLEGAVRTQERLVTTCELPFYRRYAKHLKRTAEGLRTRGEEP